MWKIVKYHTAQFSPLLSSLRQEKMLRDPLFKSIDALVKKNYRLVTNLASVSKIYERVPESQMKSRALSFFSPLTTVREGSCGFHVVTLHALMRLLETCKTTLDR